MYIFFVLSSSVFFNYEKSQRMPSLTGEREEETSGGQRKSTMLNYHNKRWNSGTAFLLEISRLKFESPKTQAFVCFSTLIFHFYKMLLTNRFKFSCFVVNFCKEF